MTKIFTASVFIFTLTGCTHNYYIQTTQNVPLFREKNEYRAAVSLGGGSEINTVDIQAAYSITNQFAVMTNFMLASGGDRPYSSWGEGKYFEGAFGYFKPLEEHGVLEIYGGFGSGNQHHYYQGSSSSSNDGTTSYREGMADLSFTRMFLQPSYGVTFSGFDLALTTGFSYISFNRINNRIDTLDSEYFAVDDISKNRNSFLFEPSFTIRGGWKYVKLQLQLGSSKNLSHQNLKFETSKFSVGLTFAFAQRFRKSIATPTGR